MWMMQTIIEFGLWTTINTRDIICLFTCALSLSDKPQRFLEASQWPCAVQKYPAEIMTLGMIKTRLSDDVVDHHRTAELPLMPPSSDNYDIYGEIITK